MNTAQRYAHMLYAVAKEHPSEAPAALHSLIAMLKERRYEKMLPQVYGEYQKLILAEDRRNKHAANTPERERTRVLLELYRTLIAS